MTQHTSSQPTRGRLRACRTDRGAVSSLAVGGSAVAAIALVGGGLWAATQLGGGGDQPSDVLPDSAFAYARIDLDPSASQKVDLIRLLQRFPEFEEQTGISSDRDDLRRALAESALEDADCDVDYADDIEPWIGNRVGFAGLPGADGGEPVPVSVLQVTDASAAEDGLTKLAGCGTDDTGEPVAFAFAGDYVVLAETQEVADAAVADGEDSPLSDDEQFTTDMDRLGDPGLASFWVDVPAVVKLAEQSGADMSELGLTGFDAAQANSVYGTFRAGSDNLELAVLTSGEQVIENGDSPVGELPESTLLALSVSGLGDALPGQWDKLRDTFEQLEPGSFDSEVAQFEQETGLQLPDDLATLLGDNVTMAVDADGLDPATFSDETFTPASIDAGIRFTGDSEAIQDVVDRIQAALAEQGVPFELVTEEVDDGVVVASNDDYATAMDDGDLAGDEGFEGAVGETDDTAALFYLDVDAVSTIAEQLARQQGGDTSFVDFLDPVRAIGVNGTVEDGYSQVIVRMTFDDE